MCFNVQYGDLDKTKLYEIVKTIAEDVKIGPVESKMAFYFEDLRRSFSDLIAPNSIPQCLNGLEEGRCKIIKKTLYKTSAFCYLEIIPGLGSLVGVIFGFIRIFTIEPKSNSLKKAVNDLSMLPKNAPESERFQKSANVFNEAVKFSNEVNLYWGSVSAIIPLHKLAIGLMRGAAFHLAKP